jgi:hypothetical protein
VAGSLLLFYEMICPGEIKFSTGKKSFHDYCKKIQVKKGQGSFMNPALSEFKPHNQYKELKHGRKNGYLQV